MKIAENLTIINGGTSFQWSFGPFSTCGSIESTTILTTHPSLLFITNYLELYWLVCEFSASIYTIEGLLINFSSRERVRPRFRMTVTFYQKLSKLIELIAPYNRSEFFELLIVITRLSNPIRTRFTLYSTPKVMGK